VRLALSFGVLVALMLLVIALAVGQFRAMAQQSERVTQRDLQRMLFMQRIHQHAQGNGSAMARLLTAPRPERELIYPLIDAEFAAIDRLLAQLSQRSAEALPAGRIAELLHWRNVYREVFALVGEHIESGEADSARALYGTRGSRR